jgi:hypothetical protein
VVVLTSSHPAEWQWPQRKTSNCISTYQSLTFYYSRITVYDAPTSSNEETPMPKKKKALKKHSVRANLQVVELTRAGSSLDLEIYADNEKIGTMIIGRGSLVWFGGKRQLRKRIPWSRFAEMMDELAYG